MLSPGLMIIGSPFQSVAILLPPASGGLFLSKPKRGREEPSDVASLEDCLRYSSRMLCRKDKAFTTTPSHRNKRFSQVSSERRSHCRNVFKTHCCRHRQRLPRSPVVCRETHRSCVSWCLGCSRRLPCFERCLHGIWVLHSRRTWFRGWGCK